MNSQPVDTKITVRDIKANTEQYHSSSTSLLTVYIYIEYSGAIIDSDSHRRDVLSHYFVYPSSMSSFNNQLFTVH